MVRRRKRTRRRPKVVNVGLVELGTGLALASAVNAPSIIKNVQKANFAGAFDTLSNAFTNKSNQQKMVGIGISAVLAKAVSKSLRVRRIGKIGPLALNI